MDTKRKKFQGVINILSFNRHFYVLGFAILAAVLTLKIVGWFTNPYASVVLLLLLYGLLVPLLVSTYVYDFSNYYTLDWVKETEQLNGYNKRILNIHSGFDETSYLIKQKFPKPELLVFDFYDPSKHTEKSIARARKISNVYPNTLTINPSNLPLDNKSVDVIFVLLAAHEIRIHKEKVDFFKECKRVLKEDGKLIMVEHLRDLPNFLAFTIGFTHFFSKKVWASSLYDAGFTKFSVKKLTAFITIFNSN
jgi:SAM-dependent methyltransferase